MEIVLICLALILSIIGVLGCIIPGLPGPPLNFIALMLMQWAFSPFSTNFIVISAFAVLLVTLLDYLLPVWIAKKFGASREGVIGSMIGLIVGMLFAPIGMVFGLLAGAIIGDLIAGKNFGEAVFSGIGSALGTLFSTGFKLIVSAVLSYYIFKEVILRFFG